MKKNRLLVVTRHTPLPWDDGAGAYLFDMLSYIHAAGFEVHIAWLAPHDHLRWQGVWKLPASFCDVVTLHTPGGIRIGHRQFYPAVYWLPRKARLMNRLKRMLIGLGLWIGPKKLPVSTHPPTGGGWMAPPSQDELEYVAKLLGVLKPGLLFASYPWMCPIFDLAKVGLRVCIQYDVAWLRARFLSEISGETPEVTPQMETALLSRAQVVACISACDAAEVRRLAPQALVTTCPKSFSSAELPPSSGSRLLFVGGCNQFNVEGLDWFLEKVWPLVRMKHPEVELDICGSVGSMIKQVAAGVNVHGYVDSLRAYYEGAALVIVPLRRCTGLNIKLVEAAGYGRATVTTSATLMGAPFFNDCFRVEDSAEGFSTAVVELLSDPALRAFYAARASDAVKRTLSPRNCYEPLLQAMRNGLSDLGAQPPKSI